MEFSQAERTKCLERYFGRGEVATNGRNFDDYCPFCDDKRRDKRKLSIHIMGGMWQCWRCSTSGGHIGYVVRRFNLGDPTELLRIWPRAYEDKEVGKSVVRPRLPADFKLIVADDRKLPDLLALKRYCRSRDLTEDDMWRYRLGFSKQPEWARRVIVPSFDAEGELNYYTGRAIDKSAYQRYNTVGMEKRDVIFNEIDVDWTQELVLCEGPFDMMKCGDNVVPLLGSSLSEHSALFCAIVSHGTPVALALDKEMKERAMKLVKTFDGYAIKTRLVDLGGHKDPGEMKREEFQKALDKAREVDWRQRMMEGLARAKKVSMKV